MQTLYENLDGAHDEKFKTCIAARVLYDEGHSGVDEKCSHTSRRLTCEPI